MMADGGTGKSERGNEREKASIEVYVSHISFSCH